MAIIAGGSATKSIVTLLLVSFETGLVFVVLKSDQSITILN